MKTGVLLINLGTPNSPDVKQVRQYLKEFLSDPRVIDLPFYLRYPLLYFFILPFRPKQSAHAYQSIWTAEGSPLLINSLELKKQVEELLGDQFHIALGMRYGQPSIAQALNELACCNRLIIIPLFPQYSSAATGSALNLVLNFLKTKINIPSLHIIREFYNHPNFIMAQAALIKPMLGHYDHILFSYHGLPERQIQNSGCTPVCKSDCSLSSFNSNCYRAQCYQTSQELAKKLSLDKTAYSTSFQSRLGKTKWIQPYTDTHLTRLYEQGVRRLLICCPSFVADCLETLEEIGIRAHQQWMELGGEALDLVPCVNASPLWVEGLCQIILEAKQASD